MDHILLKDGSKILFHLLSLLHASVNAPPSNSILQIMRTRGLPTPHIWRLRLGHGAHWFEKAGSLLYVHRVIYGT
jgi:hypothetical protein